MASRIGASISSSAVFGHMDVSCLKCPLSLLCVGGGLYFTDLCPVCHGFKSVELPVEHWPVGPEVEKEWRLLLLHVPCSAFLKTFGRTRVRCPYCP